MEEALKITGTFIASKICPSCKYHEKCKLENYTCPASIKLRTAMLILVTPSLIREAIKRALEINI